MVSYGNTATNTGTDADQNCVGLHASAIPFPTYRKNFSVCFLKLCNAQRRYLTTKLFEGASDESQDAGDSDSDEYYPSFTISTPLALDNPPDRRWLSVLPQRDVEHAPKKVCTES